jgi:hypothetical protein
MQKIVVVVSEPENRRASLSVPVAKAFERCFGRLGWQVVSTTKHIRDQPDLVAGWGFRDVMHEAWDRWPERVLHVDAGFWRRETYHKLELGGRWLPADGRDYPAERFRSHHVVMQPARAPGKTIMVAGMSAKAAISCGMAPEAWEREAVERLRAAGAKVFYRPKPTWREAKPIGGARFDQSPSVEHALRGVHGVVSHHSNVAVDALATGLPVYVETGIAKPLAVASIEAIMGATAPDRAIRERLLREVAWRQWSMKELEQGAWLRPPAPLSDCVLFA